MTKQEYIENLVVQGGLSSQEMYEMTQAWEAQNKTSQDVKTDDSAVDAETSAGSEDGTVSESESGSSESPILPGQVITKNGYEYKFEIDPETKTGLYYSRPAGTDEKWTDSNTDDSQRGQIARASIAYQFGHSDMNEEKRDEYLKQIEAHEQYKKDKAEAIKKYARDNELGWYGMITGGDGFQFSDIFDFRGPGHEKGWNIFADEARWGEAISRFGGEFVEAGIDTLDFATDRLMDVTLEPMGAALNAMGILDLSDYEDDSLVGIEFDNVINDIVAEFVIGDAAYTGDKDALGNVKGKYDFGEEVGDLVESGMLSIGAGMMAMPQLIADTKKMIGDTMGEILPEGAQQFLNSPIMKAGLLAANPALRGADMLTQKDIVESGEEAYNVFSKKAEQLNMTLADFGNVGMTEMMGDAFTGGDEGDWDMKKRLGSFIAGSTRITASALGSLPSVAQSMIPYVGIASIVAGEAARANMESKQDGRPLDWGRLGHAYVTGASEGLLELVTKKIGMGMFKGLRGAGKEVVEQSLRQYGLKVMKEFGQEGLSEVGTLLINQAADYIYKDEVDEFFPKWGEVMDTFFIGGVMGGGMSASGVGGQLINNSIARKNIKADMKAGGFNSLSQMFDTINPLVEGGLSQEIASGMEDAQTKIEAAEAAIIEDNIKDRPRTKQTERGETKDELGKIEPTDKLSKTSTLDQNIDLNQTARDTWSDRQIINKETNAIGTGYLNSKKAPTQLTADEKADANYNVLTNPKTEMFLNTELKRKVENGEMTTTKADEIKRNFKEKQGAANRLGNLGLSGQQRQKAINLLAEEKILKEEIKQVDNPSLSATNLARVEEINNELSNLDQEIGSEAIDQAVEKDVAFVEKFGNIGIKDGDFVNPIGENKAVQAFETTEDFNKFLADNNIEGDAQTDAVILGNGQILINKQHMKEAGAIGAGRHELLHKILKQQFMGPNGTRLKNEFLKILKETDPAGYQLLMARVKQTDSNGERLYSEAYLWAHPDEYLTLYASLLMEGTIPLETFEKKPSLIERLADFFSSIFADAANENPAGPNVEASDIGFKSGKDLYDFVRGYVKDSEAGVLSDRARQLAEESVSGNMQKLAEQDLKAIDRRIIPAQIGVNQTFEEFRNEQVERNQVDRSVFDENREQARKAFNAMQTLLKAGNKEFGWQSSKSIVGQNLDRIMLDDKGELRKEFRPSLKPYSEKFPDMTKAQQRRYNPDGSTKLELDPVTKRIAPGQLDAAYRMKRRPGYKDGVDKSKSPTGDPIPETFRKRRRYFKDKDAKFSKTIKPTPLESINDLIPAEIKTKEQFDNFIRDNRSAKVIADALMPGGVINNYIRSRETSREQGDKMIDEVYERIFNFDPEAKRADGTIVGPKGFGEAIFANTRFAKMVANKQLAQESERRKQEKRIDSKEAKEVAEKIDTPTKIKEDKLAKKPSETTGLDTELEGEITKAVEQWAEGKDDINFAATRNIPLAVAKIYGNLFGFNPDTLVDKKRNFQKTDSQGLTKAKQFLIKNAQADYNRLVELKDDLGKATFVPKNVRDALFDEDGNLIGTLKDYINLIKEKPTKPIYRDRTAQTIKGLLALHIRNRMLETAQPVQGKRIQGGAKFSRSLIRKNSTHNLTTKTGLSNSLKQAAQTTTMGSIMKMLGVPMKSINDTNRDTIVDDFVDSIPNNSAIITPIITGLNLANFGATNFTAKHWRTPKYDKAGKKISDGISDKERKEWTTFEENNKIIDNAKYYRVNLGNGKYTFIIGEKYTNKEGNPAYRKPSQEVLVKKFGEKGVTPPPPNFVPARGGMFHGKDDPNWKRAMDAAEINDTKGDNAKAVEAINAAKRIKIDPATGKPDPKGKNPDTGKTWTKAELDKINKKARNTLLNQIKLAVKGGMPIETAGMLVNKGYQGTTAIFKITIPFVGESIITMTDAGLTERAKAKLAKQGGPFSEITTEEHSPPVSMNMGQWMVALAYDMANMDGEGEFTTDETTVVQKAIDRNAIQIVLDIATDAALNENGFRDKVLEGQTIKTKNVAWNRLNRANHTGNPSPLENIKLYEGKTAADKTGITANPKFSKSFKNNPSALNYQQKLINDNALDSEALSTQDAKARLNISMPVQVLKNNNVKSNSNNLAPQILNPLQTAEQQKGVLVDSFKTRIRASKTNPKRKGISVFDFDDTLARTKERVIVRTVSGTGDITIKEISAAQFAKQAATLTEQGAEFDFSNFEKVAKGTKKGPLADLALKRQGKFGSGDIFVLTARPNIAGPAIQAFLKSIGINIPLKNITGLSDGTPQAKVDWILNKTAEGYNDFYFADDSKMNVDGVKAVLDAVDVKNKVQQAKFSRSQKSQQFNKQLQEVTGKEAHKKYSNVRARLEGKKKDGGWLKRIFKTFTIAPSAEDFMGLLYALVGKGEQGNRHMKFLKENLIDPYNKVEQEVLSAQVSVASDFAALKKQFPNLKSKNGSNPLLQDIGVGPYNKEQAIRVYMWNKQGMEIPGMSQRDIDALVKAVESDNELNVFADEVILIQKGETYPPPTKNWLAGDIASDIMNGINTTYRSQLLSEWNENVETIFSEENLNKIEALYGSKYREALEDSLRRMKSGSNRPIYQGGGARIVNEMLDWLNSSVGVAMFFNMRSGLLQLISNVNFINWGDNNMYAAAKAFMSKDYFPTVIKLLNSDYLVNRRDGLKINVSEAELADAGRKGGIKGMINYLLDKGFAITRIMDSVAIATGGATFFINRKKALLNRTNPKTGNKYTEAEAEKQAFDDFYEIAEETQQSSNPAKISQQQASLMGRIILAFQNVTMQYNRKTKKSILDLFNRRKKPGMTQRESDLSNMSSIVYYMAVQNMIFHGLQQALFKMAFDDEEEEKDKNKAAGFVNKMADSILFGMGFGGAIISTVKNLIMRVTDESQKKSPDYEDALWDIFDVSPVIDAKVRKLRSAAKTFQWNMDQIKKRGWSIENPAYLAIAQVISAGFNIPIDRVLQKVNNLRQATDENIRMYQRIALVLGWSGWNFDLPYWGRQSYLEKEQKEHEKLTEQYKSDAKKLKAQGYKRVPLTGPKAGKPDGELGVDYIEVERPSGEIEYWRKIN